MTREDAMEVVRIIESIEGLERALDNFEDYIEENELDIVLSSDEIQEMRNVISKKLDILNERLKYDF